MISQYLRLVISFTSLLTPDSYLVRFFDLRVVKSNYSCSIHVQFIATYSLSDHRAQAGLMFCSSFNMRESGFVCFVNIISNRGLNKYCLSAYQKLFKFIARLFTKSGRKVGFIELTKALCAGFVRDLLTSPFPTNLTAHCVRSSYDEIDSDRSIRASFTLSQAVSPH